MGHIRSECRQSGQKCRVCLQDYKEGHNVTCTKQYHCAQCKQNHYSLDSNCKVIQEYRTNLNKAVKQAKSDGTIKLPQVETKQMVSVQPLKFDLNSFPSLQGSIVRQPFRPSSWKMSTAATTMPIPSQSQAMDITNQELFEKICSHFDIKAHSNR